MDSSTRKEKLMELRNNQKPVMTGIPLRYKGATLTENVYRIPLDYLIYNKYNGRIGSDVLSYEKQNGVLKAENDDDCKIIEKFLYESKEDRNKTTMRSLCQNGQQRYGIVTSNGIIIDGNRRAMLLNRLFHKRTELGYELGQVEHCRYFLAIILPDDAEERDIQQLETIYQMGEDDKLDYNPIEKYLKCKGLKQVGFSEEDIAGFMNEKPGQIKTWLSILELMEEYLREYDYDGIYTRLEKTEGPFVDLEGYLDSYKKQGANIRNMNWTYSDSDISDLKRVCFDYIRARYEGKEFRDIAKTGKDGSIFFYKELWEAFLQEHQAKTPGDEESVDELRKQHPHEDLSKLLRSRDNDWIGQSKGILKGNLRRFSRKLEDQQDSHKPVELIERALGALQAVDCEQDSFSTDPRIKDMVREINNITWTMKKRLDRS
ncbi:hypothetical protein NXG27_07325 [Megasphaera paucivorans]|uniref:Uncharacterized protein n=1 Tax=Megasphaera paucivorans TaxID=349095 RepID=A0A1G9WZ15_9FIRM|nr:hypothetical protein [Megasphaera paucivorans]SDM89699.1 hypothetical protein SAMN05660299_01718 [Megasphaera paucivorans]